VKNGTPLALLSAFNDVKGGCFRAVFTAIQRALACFKRKIRALFERRLIEPKSAHLLMVGYDLRAAKESP
jgi:hypothetical protein